MFRVLHHSTCRKGEGCFLQGNNIKRSFHLFLYEQPVDMELAPELEPSPEVEQELELSPEVERELELLSEVERELELSPEVELELSLEVR